MLRFKHVLSTTVATILSGVLSLGLTVLVARLLTAEQNGNYAQFVLILNLANIALNFGLGPASTQMVASGRAGVSQVIRANVRAMAAISVVLALLCVGLYRAGLIDAFCSDFKIPQSLFLLGVGGGMLMLAGNQAIAIFMGCHCYDTVNALTVLRAVMLLVAVALTAVFGVRAPLQLSFAHAAGLLVAALCAFYWLAHARPGHGDGLAPSDSDAVLQTMLRYGGILYLSNLLHYSAMRGLLLLVSRYETSAAVGYLTTALLLLEVTLLVPSAIGQLLFPQSSGAAFDGSRLQTLLRMNMYAGVLTIALVMLLARPLIVTLMGARYEAVAIALIHLTPSVILLAIPRILSQVLSGQGRARFPLIAAVLSFALGLPLSIVLLPRFGYLGAAWVTNGVSLITAVVTLIGYSRTHGVSIAEMLWPRRSDLAMLARFAKVRGT